MVLYVIRLMGLIHYKGIVGGTSSSCSFQTKNYNNQTSLPEGSWGLVGLFFEEIIEVCRIFETQAVRYLRHIPVGMPQQRFGFVSDAVGYMFSGGLTGCFFYSTVQMVNMNGQSRCIIGSFLESQHMVRCVDRELAFQQLDKQIGYTGRAVGVLKVAVGWLKLECLVQHQTQVITQHIVLIYVVRIQLYEHFFKDFADFGHLPGLQEEHRRATGSEQVCIVQTARIQA